MSLFDSIFLMSLAVNTAGARSNVKLSPTFPTGISSPLDVIKHLSGRDYKNFVYKSQIDDAAKNIIEIGPNGGVKILDKNRLDSLIYGLSGVFDENIIPLASKIPFSYPEAALESLLSASYTLSKAYKARERVSAKSEHRFDADYEATYSEVYKELIKVFYPGKTNSFSPFDKRNLKSGYAALGDFQALKALYEKLKQTSLSQEVKEKFRYELNNRSKETVIRIVKELLDITCGITNLKEAEEFALNKESEPSSPASTPNATTVASITRLIDSNSESTPPGFLFNPGITPANIAKVKVGRSPGSHALVNKRTSPQKSFGFIE